LIRSGFFFVHISDFESQLETVYTIDTLTAIRDHYPDAAFVWIMGADNLAQISEWKDWEEIFATLPIAVFDRPTYSVAALTCHAAERFASCRIQASQAHDLAGLPPPAWVFIRGELNDASATLIRQANHKPD